MYVCARGRVSPHRIEIGLVKHRQAPPIQRLDRPVRVGGGLCCVSVRQVCARTMFGAYFRLLYLSDCVFDSVCVCLRACVYVLARARAWLVGVCERARVLSPKHLRRRPHGSSPLLQCGDGSCARVLACLRARV